jgi:hypothetical protein
VTEGARSPEPGAVAPTGIEEVLVDEIAAFALAAAEPREDVQGPVLAEDGVDVTDERRAPAAPRAERRGDERRREWKEWNESTSPEKEDRKGKSCREDATAAPPRARPGRAGNLAAPRVRV